MSENITVNRKARFNYTIEEELEAGIMLVGSELKSIRKGKININDAYVGEQNGSLFLLNAHIAEYEGANQFNHKPTRARQLLLHKKQIDKLLGKMQIKGMSVVPLSMYFNKRNIVKVIIGLARGKKLYDKRETIKARDNARQKARGQDE